MYVFTGHLIFHFVGAPDAVMLAKANAEKPQEMFSLGYF